MGRTRPVLGGKKKRILKEVVPQEKQAFSFRWERMWGKWWGSAPKRGSHRKVAGNMEH